MNLRPPTWFLEDLRDADRLLECRWSDAFKQWAIERPHEFLASEVELYLSQHRLEEALRVSSLDKHEQHAHDQNARLAWENFESARRGRALILVTPFLDCRTFARLFEMDVSRNGGFRKYYNRVIAERDRERARKKRDRYWDTRERAEEGFSFVNWAERKRQTEILMGPKGGDRLWREAYGPASL